LAAAFLQSLEVCKITDPLGEPDAALASSPDQIVDKTLVSSAC
jgi:hypothetical protein